MHELWHRVGNYRALIRAGAAVRERSGAQRGPSAKTGQQRVKERKVVRFQPPNVAFI